ncbi:MAG: hypothetical protein MUC62_04285 [Candidatus Thermoplasmatota archaeon]|jgi:hypothetical protein|nr:hypothetical protein [Candidatus Thermoplasmatota archaeon]
MKIFIKIYPVLVTIICSLTILSGCIINNDEDYFKSISVIYMTNEITLNISDLNYPNNVKLFTINSKFNNGEYNMKLDFYNNNNSLNIVRVSEVMNIRYIKPFKQYYFKFEIDNYYYDMEKYDIIGQNNSFDGYLTFDKENNIHWNIENKYTGYYNFSLKDNNILIIKLFPNFYNYNLFFSFYLSRTFI